MLTVVVLANIFLDLYLKQMNHYRNNDTKMPQL